MKHLKPEEAAQSIVCKYLGVKTGFIGEKEQELVKGVADTIKHYVNYEKSKNNTELVGEEIGGEVVDSGYAKVGTALFMLIEDSIRSKYKTCKRGVVYRVRLSDPEIIVVMEENNKYDGFLYWATL